MPRKGRSPRTFMFISAVLTNSQMNMTDPTTQLPHCGPAPPPAQRPRTVPATVHESPGLPPLLSLTSQGPRHLLLNHILTRLLSDNHSPKPTDPVADHLPVRRSPNRRPSAQAVPRATATLELRPPAVADADSSRFRPQGESDIEASPARTPSRAKIEVSFTAPRPPLSCSRSRSACQTLIRTCPSPNAPARCPHTPGLVASPRGLVAHRRRL